MRRRARIVLVAYLALLGVGVFGPEPGEELDAAAGRLRDLETEVRERLDATTSTPAGPTNTAPPSTATPAPSAAGQRDRWLDDLRAEPFFNVVVFVPIGALLPLCWPRWWWFTVLAGAQLSGAIELVQDVFLDWRSPRVEDVRWNTLGTAVGFALWALAALPVPTLRPGTRRRRPGAGRD